MTGTHPDLIKYLKSVTILVFCSPVVRLSSFIWKTCFTKKTRLSHWQILAYHASVRLREQKHNKLPIRYLHVFLHDTKFIKISFRVKFKSHFWNSSNFSDVIFSSWKKEKYKNNFGNCLNFVVFVIHHILKKLTNNSLIMFSIMRKKI